MMRARFAAALALSLVIPACGGHAPAPRPDQPKPIDLPREVLLQKLGELLPTADYTVCTLPKVTIRATEVRAWNVRSDAIEIEYGKSGKVMLSFNTITQVQLGQVGKYSAASVFTNVQSEVGKDHFQFQWHLEDRAKQAVELLLSLARK